MRRHIHRSKRQFLSPTAWRIRLALWGGATTVGLLATLFAVTSEHAGQLFAQLVEAQPYAPLVLSPAGLVLVAWLTRRHFPGAQGSGIPQTLAALEVRASDPLRATVLSFRIAIGKVLLTLLGLLSGASIGREGPTVHIGAAIMFSVGRWVRFPPHHMEKSLILAGGAAGIAAAFNTPLAGIVFAVEEISRSFEERTSGVVLTAVIFAGMTALVILGNYSYFGSTSAELSQLDHWIAVPICGVIGGGLGGLFSQTLVWSSRRIAPWYRAHPMAVAGLCGLAVAFIGLASGHLSYGTGYPEAQRIVSGELLDPGYPFYKMLASIASYLSGIPGGIFAPSLATGAGLGADLTTLLPHVDPKAVIILAMVGYFTGVVQTPITAFVIVMEMTDNHRMLLPLMATAFIAYGTSRLICPQPIYRALAAAFLEPLRPQGTQSREAPTGEGVRGG